MSKSLYEKTNTQLLRTEQMEGLLEKDDFQKVSTVTGERIQDKLFDEAQLSEDVIPLGKKTWKPNQIQEIRNERIDKAKKLTDKATADTLMVYDTIKKSLDWQVEPENALSLLLTTNFDPKMLISANIRAHFEEYMQILRSYEIVKREASKVPDYQTMLEPMQADLELFSRRMQAFAEQNRIRLDGTVLKDKEKAAEFTLNKEEIIDGNLFSNTKAADNYNFENIGKLDWSEIIKIQQADNIELKEEATDEQVTDEQAEKIRKEKAITEQAKKIIKDQLSSEDEKAYSRKDAYDDVMKKERHLGYKFHRYRYNEMGKYDTPERRISDIADMRAQLRFIEDALKSKYDTGAVVRNLFSIADAPQQILQLKKDRLEVLTRLNLAEAEARLAFALEEKDAQTKEAAEKINALETELKKLRDAKAKEKEGKIGDLKEEDRIEDLEKETKDAETEELVKETKDAVTEAAVEKTINDLETKLEELKAAEALKTLAIADKIKDLEKDVKDVWDDYRRSRAAQAKAEMPLSSYGLEDHLMMTENVEKALRRSKGSHMTRSEAITSESDQKNYTFKMNVYKAAAKLDDGIPALKEVKEAAFLYARKTHYNVSIEEESELLRKLYVKMDLAEEANQGAALAELNRLKAELNLNSIPAFENIPDNIEVRVQGDNVVHKGAKLDYSNTELKENGSLSDEGHIRNAFLNNDAVRKWVDMSSVPIFPHEPTINDIRQGKVSNCYMLAATTSLIQHDPDAIKHCIRDNGDGTATVRLYRKPGEPVFIRIKKAVPRIRATDGAILSSGPLWIQLIEMAAAHVGMFKTDKNGQAKTGIGSLWYGTGSEWLQMLTGVDASDRDVLLSSNNTGAPVYTSEDVGDKNALFEKIRDAKANNQIIHMITKKKTTDGLNSGHAYTVLGARTVNDRKYVTLRNPYANMSYIADENGEATKSSSYFSSEADATCGQFDIPLSVFIRNAGEVSLTDLSGNTRGSKYYFADERRNN